MLLVLARPHSVASTRARDSRSYVMAHRTMRAVGQSPTRAKHAGYSMRPSSTVLSFSNGLVGCAVAIFTNGPPWVICRRTPLSVTFAIENEPRHRFGGTLRKPPALLGCKLHRAIIRSNDAEEGTSACPGEAEQVGASGGRAFSRSKKQELNHPIEGRGGRHVCALMVSEQVSASGRSSFSRSKNRS